MPGREYATLFLSGFDARRRAWSTAVAASHLSRVPRMLDKEPPAEQLRVRGAGPTLSYEAFGPTAGAPTASAITLLCLHGNSSHRGVWRPVARELHEFRCVLLDLRGHGGSEHVSPPAYNPEHHAADVAQVIPR